jgi:hypothetical protein
MDPPNHLWFYWPLLGWGIGGSFHGLKVLMPFLGQDWEKNKGIYERARGSKKGANK